MKNFKFTFLSSVKTSVVTGKVIKEQVAISKITDVRPLKNNDLHYSDGKNTIKRIYYCIR